MFKPKVRETDYEYFTIYDSKTESYREPMLAVNQHDMLRQIDGLFRDPAQERNQLLTNAEDFSVYKIGTFTKKTGLITSVQPPEHIANLHEIRAAVRSTQPPLGIVST
ncbi:MAG: nonstructural protein [Microvirus sp.]|nr:MAG: nonstructural protein [Microvirus sp.]